MNEVLYTAAHGGFSLERIPLGGGAAVCNHLLDEWRRTRPFSFELLDPAIMGDAAPRDKELVTFSEMESARFCMAFENRITQCILARDPGTTAVLCNDVSEGP